MFTAFLVAAFALLCLRFPSVWSALMAIDEPSDHRELGLVVATRTFPPHPPIHHLFSLPLSCTSPIAGTPFRDSGPPACMAKLIMMRHKVRTKYFSLSSPRIFTLHSHVTPKSPAQPGQHPTAANHDTRAARHTSAAVHVVLAAPTTCAVDAHPQTFRSPASLTPAIIHLHLHHHSPCLVNTRAWCLGDSVHSSDPCNDP